jgi:hypothetical protein
MPKTRIVIGPFRRRAFAEALASSLDRDPWITVRNLDSEDDVSRLLDSSEPLVILLEQRGNDGWRRFLPKSENVSVILIEEEGQGDIQVSLRNVETSRLRSAIGILAETPHPKVISFDGDAPLVVRPIRDGDRSGLAWVVSWLDAAFVRTLQGYAAARPESADMPWMQDLTYLIRSFSRGETITAQVEEDRFQSLVDAPMWQLRLFRTFRLAPEELKLLCLAAAPDLDQRYGQAIGLLQNNYAENRPNSSTLAMFFSDDHIGADVDAMMAERRSFSRLRMIRRDADGAASGLRVSRPILELMQGVRRWSGPDWWLQTTALDADAELETRVAQVFGTKSPPIIVSGSGAGFVASEMAAAAIASAGPVLRVDCAKIRTPVAERLTEWALVARIHRATLLIEGIAALKPEEQDTLFSTEFEGLLHGRIYVGSKSHPRSGSGPATTYLPVSKPSPGLTAARWKSAMQANSLDVPQALCERLAGTLRLLPDDISGVAQMAADSVQLAPDRKADDAVLTAARNLAVRGAPETVRLPPCIFEWDDIILPGAIKTLVKSIPEHVRFGPKVLDQWDFASRLPYGRGIGAMFSGPSGTGKTMCAQVIAASLGVELMQVEIARCVSKYIGETEKNIDRCFEAAEAASAVLLFDEADALFGKRTEIKDAHDRHANVEVAYLLQRIEAYEGLVLLTTNLKSNIDAAFLRRLRFVVDFPMPDAADRARIWDLAIPKAAKCAADVDNAFLARRLPLSGGSIQSIAVNAAFNAAAEGTGEIHMRHIMAATRAELIKMGMLSAERELPEPQAQACEGVSS